MEGEVIKCGHLQQMCLRGKGEKKLEKCGSFGGKQTKSHHELYVEHVCPDECERCQAQPSMDVLFFSIFFGERERNQQQSVCFLECVCV